VSGVEILSYLKKQLGIITKLMEEKGVLATPSFRDHKFIPELEVDDVGVALDMAASLYKVKALDVPVYVNIDRPIGSEYVVVFPGSYRVIPRIGGKLYLKAPSGYKSRVSIEALW